ncbi:response regulator [Acinetobacter puyangensis]|uniref:response regulator n=1 Tax=Acinetobacter puyangensis TaxID=1096779 RepID=UPI003A4D2F4D
MVSSQELTLPIPVLIVEDDAAIQHRLKDLLLNLGYQQDMLIFAQTLQAALDILKQQPVSFALVDLGLPDGNGKTFIEALRHLDPSCPILVISAWSTQDAILGAIQAGATGYVLKERDDLEVSMSIRSILRGGAPIDPFIAQQILSKLISPLSNAPRSTENIAEKGLLSHREHEILELVAKGMSNKEIAEFIHLSRYTVECHIKHIYRKLSVSSRAKAINTARSLGILP